MEQLKYKIGEFSRLGRVTVRTLRHYGEIGLLKPEIIDRQTGYRYYSARQLQKLLAIVQLKELGFSLAEIRDLYEEDTHFPDIRMMERRFPTAKGNWKGIDVSVAGQFWKVTTISGCIW